MTNKVYIVHEYGAPSHFYALEYLLASQRIQSAYYELNIWGQVKKVVKTFSARCFLRLCRNLGFLFSLPFLKPAKVVLGLAPYDRRLVRLRPWLKRHQVFYFTSYTCWDGTRQVHRSGPRTVSAWRAFLQHGVDHVFAVSEKTRKELIRNGLASPSRVTVVGHSYVARPMAPDTCKRNNLFVTAGALDSRKGIEELLACFAARPDAHLTILGKGPLERLVKEYEAACPNIHYAGYVSDQNELFNVYRKHSFFVLNSKRTPDWEELFGMVLIEASACGLVPLAPHHVGPCEILQDGENGILFAEGNVSSAVDACMGWSEEQYGRLRASAIKNGERFFVDNMANRWVKVLE